MPRDILLSTACSRGSLQGGASCQLAALFLPASWLVAPHGYIRPICGNICGGTCETARCDIGWNSVGYGMRIDPYESVHGQGHQGGNPRQRTTHQRYGHGGWHPRLSVPVGRWHVCNATDNHNIRHGHFSRKLDMVSGSDNIKWWRYRYIRRLCNHVYHQLERATEDVGCLCLSHSETARVLVVRRSNRVCRRSFNNKRLASFGPWCKAHAYPPRPTNPAIPSSTVRKRINSRDESSRFDQAAMRDTRCSLGSRCSMNSRRAGPPGPAVS